MNYRTLKNTLLVIAAVIGLVLVGTAGPAAARGSLRAEIDLALVADSNVVVDGELVAYVGTYDFGRDRVYGYAYFSPDPPTPVVGDWVTFSGRFEFYDTTDFYVLDEGVMTTFDPPAPILAGTEWGFGNTERNVWYGFDRITDVDADGISMFRRVEPGDRGFWDGEFAGPTSFVGTFRLFSR